ncbi:hypothetical protein [Actinotignum urinale]|uniref:hypothetical protein n=1 Tax=Actinotignum urinale TaxID=190146 RepID=UPI00370D5B53
MSDMHWALEVATKHPQLADALITTSGPWLDILLADGRTFRFRPFELIRDNLPPDVRQKRLIQLLTIGINNATKASVEEPSLSDHANRAHPGENTSSHDDHPSAYQISEEERKQQIIDSIIGKIPSEDSPVIPLVRAADFFVNLRNGTEDSPIFIPLTDFIGVGLSSVEGDDIQTIFFNDIGFDPETDDLYPLFHDAVHTFHRLNSDGKAARIELGVYEGNGAKVFMMETPSPHQCAWFADVEMLRTVAESLKEEYPDTLFLFIPATPYALFIVRADDEFLPEALENIMHYPDQDMIYPLPHTIAADGWMEWIPLPGHPASKILSQMRSHFRSRIYDAQLEYMLHWSIDVGKLATYDVHKLPSGTVSSTVWKESYPAGSIPIADYITFVDDIDDTTTEPITLSLEVARDVWPEGIKSMPKVWPPRYEITHFPDKATREALKSQSHRTI